MKSCPDCNSQKIIPHVKVLERGDGNASYSLRVALEENPDALFFKGRTYSNIKASVCADCGFIQFYAEDPKTLWATYQNRRNDV
ncbi:MAG: hypothetical protein R2747_12730 [Pyrinomonadaceae bacterium]